MKDIKSPFTGFGSVKECILLAQIMTMANEYCDGSFTLEITSGFDVCSFSLMSVPKSQCDEPHYLYQSMTLQQLHDVLASELVEE